MRNVALMIIAKDPVAGRAKTRLSPPLSPNQAADLAEAALLDTLDVLGRTPAYRKVLVLDGDARRWRRDGLEVIAQRGAGLEDRLAAAFEDVSGPALLVGMDTPQLTVDLLLDGIDALEGTAADAVLGPAQDGGYWSVGLRRASREVFSGVPMSSPTTLSHQRARLLKLGLRVHEQQVLRDVDTFEDARQVACDVPDSRFAAVLAAVS